MRSIVFMIFMINSAFCFAQFAEFSFEEKKVFKADPIQEGETLEYTWNFVNTGDAPLIISDYEVSCSCTKAFFSKAPIAPKDSSSIRVTFDSNGKIGWQYRKVKLIANTKKGEEEIEFRVKVLNED